MTHRRSEAGMTLIEMMIAVLISMILSVAVMIVMSTFEGRRRTLGSASDLDQAGNLAMYQMDRWIRSAGSGLGQSSGYSYGCELFASKASAQLLPIPASPLLPAPFSSVTGIVRLAPVMILPNQNTPAVSGSTSDMLVVMSTGNDASQMPTLSTAPATAAQLTVLNTTEFSPRDLVLIGDQQPDATTGGPASCMVSQIASTLPANGVGKALPLAGTYYAATVGARSVASYTQNSVALDLGGDGSSTATSAAPQFQLIGVGDNNTLFTYDLLQTTTPVQAQAQAEGVFEMHALYGVDSTGSTNNIVDQWVSPSTSAYTVSALTDGSPTAALLLKRIRAVHVALILRTSLPEKAPVGPTSLTYFNNVQGVTPVSRPLAGLPSTEQYYRYRVVETTIPVRNNNY